MAKHKRLTIFIILLILLTLSGFRIIEAFTLAEIARIIQEADEMLFPSISVVTIEMINSQPNRPDAKYEMKCYRKNDNMLVEYLSPPVEKGNKFLRHENSLWFYLNTSKTTIRISPKGNDMGGALDNNDLLRVNLLEDYDIKYLGLEKISGNNCYKFQLNAKNPLVAYDQVIYWVSQEAGLPVRKEFYSISRKLVKVGNYTLSIEDGEVRGSLILESMIRKGFVTKITFLKIEEVKDLPSRMFSINYLKAQ